MSRSIAVERNRFARVLRFGLRGVMESESKESTTADDVLADLDASLPNGDTWSEIAARDLFESFKITKKDVLLAGKFLELPGGTHLHTQTNLGFTVRQVMTRLVSPDGWLNHNIIHTLLGSASDRATANVMLHPSLNMQSVVEQRQLLIDTKDPKYHGFSEVRRFVRVMNVTDNHFVCSVVDTSGVPAEVAGQLSIPLEQKLCRILAPSAPPRVYILESIPGYAIPIHNIHMMRGELAARAQHDAESGGPYRPSIPSKATSRFDIAVLQSLKQLDGCQCGVAAVLHALWFADGSKHPVADRIDFKGSFLFISTMRVALLCLLCRGLMAESSLLPKDTRKAVSDGDDPSAGLQSIKTSIEEAAERVKTNSRSVEPTSPKAVERSSKSVVDASLSSV